MNNINDYCSIMGILGALCLGYAGSENFRAEIDKRIITWKINLIEAIEKKNAILSVLRASSFFPKHLEKDLNLAIRFGAIYAKRQVNKISEKESCSITFKSSFLFTGLFCIAFLFFSVSIKNNIDKEYSITFLTLFACSVLIYNIIVFLITIRYNKTRVHVSIPLIIILFLIYLPSLNFSKNTLMPFIYENYHQYIKFHFSYSILIIGFLPFLLQIVRSLIWYNLYVFIKTKYSLFITETMSHEVEEILIKEHNYLKIKDMKKISYVNITKKIVMYVLASKIRNNRSKIKNIKN